MFNFWINTGKLPRDEKNQFSTFQTPGEIPLDLKWILLFSHGIDMEIVQVKLELDVHFN